MTFDIITIGGATEDINFYVDDYHLLDNKQNAAGNQLLAFDYGTKVDIAKVTMTFGGGAANTAVCFAALGFKTAGVITYGADERGKKIVANLKRRGVNTSLTQRVAGDISGFSFIVIGANNEHVAFSHRAANACLTIKARQLRAMRRAKWLFLTSLTGNWKHNLERIFCAANGVKIAWNPGEKQIDAGCLALKKYLKRTNVLTLNKDEAIKLVASHKDHASESYDFLASSQNLLKVIHSWGPQIVVVTNGEHGADAYDGSKFYAQPAIRPQKREDTTGLGDAFGSSFVSGLQFYNNDIKQALWLAAQNAAAVLSAQGAQNGLLTRRDLPRLETLYKKTKSKKR